MTMLPLKRREKIADRTIACWFDTADIEFDFDPGQHADFTLQDPPYKDDRGIARTFSIASSPHNTDELLIATRKGESAYKRSLRELEIGTEIEVMGPMGSMTLHSDTEKPGVFLTGGIGITPFRSMISWATHEETSHDISLFYSNKTQAEAAFWTDLRAWEEENPGFTFIPTFTEDAPAEWQGETGLIDAEMLRRHLSQDVIDTAVFYIAGPPGMIPAMQDMLEDELGVDELHIKTESFTGY